VGFVFVAQDVTHIDPLVRAACGNYIVFSQSSTENRRAAREILDLSAAEAEWLGVLEPGECFIRFVGDRDWPYAFLGRIPSDV